MKTALVKTPSSVALTRGRPPKALAIAGQKAMPERIKTIVEYHHAAESCAASAVLYAILCGMELIAARKDVPEGEWGDWLDINFPAGRATAYRYEDAARRKTRSIPQLMKVAGFSLGVAPHLLQEKQRRQLVAAIQGATDGETLASILGKGPRSYEHIGGNAKLREWLSEHYPDSKVRRVEDLTEAQRAEWAQYEASQAAELAYRKNALDRNAWGKALSTLMDLVTKRKWAILSRDELEHAAAMLQDMRNSLLEGLKK